MANNRVTVVSVFGAVAGVLLGRFLGWFFGVQFFLPIAVGFIAAAQLKKKLPEKAQVFVPALGVHAGYLTWIALEIVIRLIQGHFYIGFFGIFLHVVSIAGFIALIVQPGIPPALVLLLRHAYSLYLFILSLPPMIKAPRSFAHGAIVSDLIIGGISIAMVILLGKAVMKYKESDTSDQ
jgi:hypothetical protein